MSRIHTYNPHLLTPLLCPVLRHVLCVREVVVHTDERARDVRLLVQVCEPKARQRRSVVENRGLVLGAEACGERIPRLR